MSPLRSLVLPAAVALSMTAGAPAQARTGATAGAPAPVALLAPAAAPTAAVAPVALAAPIAVTEPRATAQPALARHSSDDASPFTLPAPGRLAVPAAPDLAARAAAPARALLIVLKTVLAALVALLLLYMGRHYWFTVNRLFGRQRHPYVDIDTAQWPPLTVLVAAHNEESVIADSLAALLQADYPADRLVIMPVNDRSSDDTRRIIDEIALRAGGRIRPFHRIDGKPGKAAALKDATALVDTDLIVVFDADYLPGTGLLKQLVAPFFDPEVGAVMGRVVPLNVNTNFLTRILDLERAGGYQVDQQARMNLGLVPQYGGTVGGVRVSALDSAGGWHDDVLAEDTDLTYRLLLNGWTTVYTNRSECYEEVPQEWPVRVRQIMRWAKGHNQALARHFVPTLLGRGLSAATRLDALLLLLIYALPLAMMFGWIAAILLFFVDDDPLLSGALVVMASALYCSLGNFAAFFEIGAACHLDGSRARIRLLPLNAAGFLVSLVAISRATVQQMLAPLRRGKSLHWDKTTRYRAPRRAS